VAKYNGPVCRLCRREGQKLFLKGERCLTDKCAFDRRGFAPGQHGAAKKGKLSEFGMQLREKQKVRRVYGLMERQFRTTFHKAVAKRGGVASEVFFQSLETRLDNVIFRMGFARSRAEARQLVGHDHVLVNGKKINISSARVKVGDEIALKDKSKKLVLATLAAELFRKRAPIPWVQVDHDKFVGKVVALPTRDDIQLNVKERLIVELYSK
jgi:small subunit ribosomal protein S4